MDGMQSVFILMIFITIIIPVGPILLLAALKGNALLFKGYLKSILIYILVLLCSIFFSNEVTIRVIFISPIIILAYSILYTISKTRKKKPTKKLNNELRFMLGIIGGILSIIVIYHLIQAF